MSQHVATFNAARLFLQNHHILQRQPPTCIMCAREMTEVKADRVKDDIIWRCPSHKGQKVPIRRGSFLHNHNISLSDFIAIVYFWSHDISLNSAVSMIGLSKPTLIDWYSYLRDVCSHKLLTTPIQIGGPGVIVEIDESVVSRRKYNRGHRVNERWVFGGIDNVTKYGFLREIERRDAATLLPLIEQYILPGSIIHSDGWPAYHGIAAIPVIPPYQHETVNHNENFVDPVTGATTNHVECMWKNMKRKLKALSGTRVEMLPAYFDEFLWKQRYGRTHDEAMLNILLHISEWFPTP